MNGVDDNLKKVRGSFEKGEKKLGGWTNKKREDKKRIWYDPKREREREL